MLIRHLQEVAARHSDQPALVWRDVRMDYGELWARAQALAEGWRRNGAGRGRRVAVLLPNGPEFVLGFLAATWLRAVFMPVNPALAENEIHAALRTLSPDFLLATAGLTAAVDTAGSATARIIPRLELPRLDAEIDRHKRLRAGSMESDPARDVDSLGLLSSGTTGVPKLIMRTQAKLLAECRMTQAVTGIGVGDRVLCALPLFHAHGLGNCLLAALGNGATLVLEPASNETGEPKAVPLLFRRKQLLQLLAEQRVTVFPGVPYLFAALTEGSPRKLPDLRLCISAGEKLPASVAQAFRRRFGCPIRQLYGCTEAGALALDEAEGPDQEPNLETVGRPLPGVEVRILDAGGKPLPPGERGQLWVSSPALCDGYRSDAGRSRATFVDGGYLSGDLARLTDDGRLVILGRSLPYIHTAGYKVDPLEVEAVLIDLPGIAEAVVIGVDDAGAGAGELVRAFIVLDPDAVPLTDADIRAQCRQRLAGYKVPKQIRILDEMPRGPSGKLRRTALHHHSDDRTKPS